MAPLPGKALLGVVRGPDVVRRQSVNTARIGDQIARGHLGPGANANALGLSHIAVPEQRPRRRLAIRPDALLQRPRQLRLVGLADEVPGLVVERRIEEEAVVLDLEVLVLLADAALAERQQLLALGEG